MSKSKEKKIKVAQPNKLARLVLQRMVEGRCSKSIDQLEKNSLTVLYTIQPEDKTFEPDLKYESGTEVVAAVSAEVVRIASNV